MAEPEGRAPTYTREEMDAILKRAIERQQAKSEEIPHEDLVAAAGEVGIPREEVEAAARDLEAEKAKQSSRTGAATPSTGPRETAPSDEARARALRRLAQRAMTFFGLSMFFFFIGHETGADWWIWPVFGMGISLVIRASRVFFGDAAEKEERQAEKRLSRRERRRMQRAERLADFERKVSIGADALVRVIEEAKGMKTRLEADLNPPRREASQAPREKQQDGPRVLVTPPPVRVETSEARERDEIEREGERGGGERGANAQSVKYHRPRTMVGSRVVLFPAATLAVACLYGVVFYGCLPTYTFGEASNADASGDVGTSVEASAGPDASLDGASDGAIDSPVDSRADSPPMVDASVDGPSDAPFDSPSHLDGAVPTAVVSAGSKQFSTGYGYQTHLVFAQNDKRFWFFYLDDTPGVIKALASPDLVAWTAEPSIPLPSGYSLSDGNNFSVAYANLAGTDVVHIVVDATGGQTEVFHIRTTIVSGTITASLPVGMPDSVNASSSCPQDGPATVVAPNGYVYDVSAWTSHSDTACDTNIYLSPGPDNGATWATGAFSHDGYFISVPSYVFAHDLVSLPEAGVVMATWPDEDNSGIYLFDSIGWALSPAFDGGGPGSLGTVPDAAAELFNGTGATSSYNDWSMCRLSDTNIHLVRHVTSTTNTVSGFQEAVYDGTGWIVGIPPPSVTSTANTGVVLLGDGKPADGVLAVTVGTDNTLNIAKSTVTGTWTQVATIPGSVQRQSLGGSGCGSAPAIVFWTEGVPDGGPAFTVMQADLTSFLGP